MLSENIKRLRTEKNMTQARLAEEMHVVRQTVSKWENGSSVPDALMLQRLAGVLETDINTLLDAPPPQSPAPKKQPLSTGARWALLMLIFWCLFRLLILPMEASVKSYESFGPLSPPVVLTLYLSCRFFARPMIASSAVFLVLSLMQSRFSTTIRLPRWVHFVALGMLFIGLYSCINCIWLNNLPFLQPLGLWLLINPNWLVLWQTAAAVLLQLSSKENLQ